VGWKEKIGEKAAEHWIWPAMAAIGTFLYGVFMQAPAYNSTVLGILAFVTIAAQWDRITSSAKRLVGVKPLVTQPTMLASPMSAAVLPESPVRRPFEHIYFVAPLSSVPGWTQHPLDKVIDPGSDVDYERSPTRKARRFANPVDHYWEFRFPYDLSKNVVVEILVHLPPRQEDCALYLCLPAVNSQTGRHENLWLEVRRGDRAPTKAEPLKLEWIAYVHPEKFGQGWDRLVVDVPEVFDQSFAKESWQFLSVRGFRIRGAATIASVEIFHKE